MKCDIHTYYYSLKITYYHPLNLRSKCHIIWLYVQVHIYVRMFIRMYVRTCIQMHCMYVYMYVCMYVCISDVQ